MQITTDAQRRRGHTKRGIGKPAFKIGSKVGTRKVIDIEQRPRPAGKIDGIQRNVKDWFYLLQCECGNPPQWMRQSNAKRIISRKVPHCKYCSRNAQNPENKPRKRDTYEKDHAMEALAEMRQWSNIMDGIVKANQDLRP